MNKRQHVGDFFKKKLEYLVGLVAIILFIVISISEPGKKIELGLYNTLLQIKPEVTERNDVLLINIDDVAIEEIGAFPWTRDIIADALIRLREAGGRSIVFDIEYLSPGQAGVNREYVKTIFPKEFSGVHDDILQYLNDFTGAVAAKNIPLNSVPEVGTEMSGYVDERMKELSGSITSNIFRDNDEYFAAALKFFGHAYLTINYEKLNSGVGTDDLNKYARDHDLFTNVEDPAGLIKRENDWTLRETEYDRGIAPTILTLLEKAQGAGFPNVVIDIDGIRRRIGLLYEYEGAYVGQLVLTPLLQYLEVEKVVRSGQTLILVNALDPSDITSGKRKNITIPLDEHGYFMINWLKRELIDSKDPDKQSFRQISVYALYLADEIETKLIANLGTIKALGIKNSNGYLSYNDAVDWLLASYADLGTWKKALLDGTKTDFDAYFAARKDFFDNYGQFLSGGYDTEIGDTLKQFAATTANAKYTEIADSILKNFEIYRSEYNGYLEQTKTLDKQCKDSFCIIGYTGVGTSDIGVNPFSSQYANVGTHANIYNTIMTEEFIYPMPPWFSWLVAFMFCYFSALAYRYIKSLKGRLFFGIGSSIFVFVLFAAIFAVFRIYVQVFVPLFSVILTFLMVSILKFVFSEQEKSFLRKAFTMYLSSDVVNQIVENPALLKLGGQEKQITALFTDIKSFSTLSEKVTPEHLVQILNKYLTVMSDIVLEQKGTIDKYIGDAIVSFFGAPLDLPDHASRACLAAVRMKQAEAKLNEEMLAAGETPSPIYTRIGINSGAMVVGNMGTDNKMNYTIMGNDVNLAARLEGVNKSYGTWILVSETTWNGTNGMFLGRKLDRVRVVGINTPVQLYNVMAVLAEASGKMVTLVDRFNLAIDAYREKRLSDALLLFTKCTELDSEDAASQIFLDRVKELIKNGIPEDWSDVINMTSK